MSNYTLELINKKSNQKILTKWKRSMDLSHSLWDFGVSIKSYLKEKYRTKNRKKNFNSGITNEFFCEMFSRIESTSDKMDRKSFLKRLVRIIIFQYSCLVDEDLIADYDCVYEHVALPNGWKEGDKINISPLWGCEELRNRAKPSIRQIKLRESALGLIVFKLLCFYAGLAVSDRRGAEKCKNLAKKLSVNWQKTTPESVTLSYLKKNEKNSKLPINELELLEKYSF